MTLPRKPARYWGDADFNALADAIEGVESSMPITYVQNDAPTGNIPDGSVWVDADAVPAQAYVWDGTQWVDLSGQPGEQGPPGLDGLDGDDGLPGPAGTSSYTHIAYANQDVSPWTGFSTSDAVNKLYIGMRVDDVQADSQNPADYLWTLIKGQDGTQGIPGEDGVDGQTPYFHTAWATNSTGTEGFSLTDPTGRFYLGTYTDYVSADSTDPGVYTWALFKGPQGDPGDQGIPGAAGDDGLPAYLHFAYATSSDGTQGFSTSDPVGKTYLGTYSDHTEADSQSPAAYTWALFKGADGSNGSNGADGARGPGNFHYQSSISTQAAAESFFNTYANNTVGTPVFQDRFTYFNPTGSPPWTITKFWDGDSWEPMAAYIDGNLLVSGTVAADELVGNIVRTANYQILSGTEGQADEVAQTGAKMQTAPNGIAFVAAVDAVKFGATKFSDLWSWGWERRHANITYYNSGAGWVKLSSFTSAARDASFVRGCIALGSGALALKVTLAGTYLITWHMSVSLPSVGNVSVELMKNSTVVTSTGALTRAGEANQYYRIGGQNILTLAANDEIDIGLYCATGVTTTAREIELVLTRMPD